MVTRHQAKASFRNSEIRNCERLKRESRPGYLLWAIRWWNYDKATAWYAHWPSLDMSDGQSRFTEGEFEDESMNENQLQDFPSEPQPTNMQWWRHDMFPYHQVSKPAPPSSTTPVLTVHRVERCRSRTDCTQPRC